MKKTKASVVIPVWNEKKNIGMVLKAMPKGYEIIVVDDGSTDNTAEVVKSFGHDPLVLESHRGKGYACLKGAEAARGEFIIFMDGDGQHDPRDLENFLVRLKKNDLVVGHRPFSSIPLHRKFSNWLANLAVNSTLNSSFNDVQCGFRGIRKSKLKNISLRSRGYEFEIDMIMKASKMKMRIAQIPISVAYHDKSIYGKKFSIGSRMPLASSFGLFVYLIRIMLFHRFMY